MLFGRYTKEGMCSRRLQCMRRWTCRRMLGLLSVHWIEPKGVVVINTNILRQNVELRLQWHMHNHQSCADNSLARQNTTKSKVMVRFSLGKAGNKEETTTSLRHIYLLNNKQKKMFLPRKIHFNCTITFGKEVRFCSCQIQGDSMTEVSMRAAGQCTDREALAQVNQGNGLHRGRWVAQPRKHGQQVWGFRQRGQGCTLLQGKGTAVRH